MANIFVSVSGGETSWFMAQLLQKQYGLTHNLYFGFANTGREREETLIFNEKCSEYFGIPITWVEAEVHFGKRKGCTHKIVDFNSASRNGEPFIEIMKKYGIPNVSFLHCTREMKGNPLKSLADKYFGKGNYLKAIGIRVDEIDRMSENKDKLNLIYPLVSPFPTRKTEINKFWDKMPFRLGLKSYEGNCDYCFKKTLRKLLTIRSEESGERLKWWKQQEANFENFTGGRDGVKPPYRFNRKNMTVEELERLSFLPFERAKDEKMNFGNQYTQTSLFDYEMDISNGCEESCEPFH